MASGDRITALVLEAQQRVFRLAERDHGLSLKAISIDTGVPYNTIRSYAGGHAVMPVPTFLKMVGVIPDDLLSHMMAPVGRCVCVEEPDEGDHDTLASNCIDFASEHAKARHPNSPGGVEIVACEDETLRSKRQQLRRKA